jgi:hypothetical protein
VQLNIGRASIHAANHLANAIHPAVCHTATRTICEPTISSFRDIHGARQVGMKTILFCPNGNLGGPQEMEPDYLLYNYADLPRAIEFLSC